LYLPFKNWEWGAVALCLYQENRKLIQSASSVSW
jgi:hypothetical protein